jgi:hypothetical protein
VAAAAAEAAALRVDVGLTGERSCSAVLLPAAMVARVLRERAAIAKVDGATLEKRTV